MKRCFGAWLALAAMLFAANSTQAASTGFNQTAAGPWDYNTAGNWVSSINGTWDPSLTLAAAQTVTFATDTSLGTGLTFNYAGNYALTLKASAASTKTITLGGDIGLNTGGGTSANVTIGDSANHLNVDLGGATRTMTVAASRTLTFADVISNGDITKAGSGTLTLSGPNTYSGLTTVNGGILTVSDSSGLGSTDGDTTVNGTDGSVNYVGTVLDLNGVTVGSGETLTLATTTTSGYRSTLRTVGNTVNTWGGNVVLTGSQLAQFTVSGSAGSLTISGSITGPSFTGSVYIRGAGTGNLNGTVDIGARPLQIFDGATWNINTTGNIWGDTTLNQGTLKLGADNALPTSTALTIGKASNGNNAIFDLNGHNQTIAGLADTTASGYTQIIKNTPSTAATLTINNTSAKTFGLAGSLISGTLLALTKSGVGMLTLSSANTYTGPTTVNAGTLKAGVASVANTSGAFGKNSAVTMANVATAILDITGFGTQIGSLTGGGTTGGNITLGAATLTVGGDNTSPAAYAGAISGTGGSLAKTGTGTLTLSGNNSYTGNTTISGGILSIAGTGSLPGWDTVSRYSVANNTVLAVYNAVTDGNITTMLGTGNFAAGASLGFDTTTADRSYTPVIANTGAGALGVTKIGANTLTLSGNNSYTGSTTVNAGKLLLNGDQSSANGAVTVASGATLGGSGTIGGDITINDGGTLNPGASGTPAKLTAKGNVSFSGSAPVFTITTSGATYDQVDCASTLGKTFTCTNGRLSLPGAPPTGTGSIKIVVNAKSIAGQFSNASGTVLGESASLSSYTGWNGWFIHYRSTYVELNQSSTPVVLLQLQALTLNGQVTVRWSTSSESKTAGFDLYRVVNGQPEKLNDTLIAAKGWPNGGIGASYSVADAGAQPGQTYTYKLVERTTDGQSIDYGPYDRTVSEFVMKPLEVTAAGAKVRWLSRVGEIYRVLKSTDLTSGKYQPIAENVAATPPENEYLDAAPGNSGFYRIELQQ